ncbi:Haloacid dehalogenase-like hydrolase [Methylomagnum ishizawai]|uniref:Haloacid dehalogenase-like hydrolase n=1 Tax=Methylomagnum ishizawai TaxID=1760988 RepID=A0A1Y6D9G8_9GAMM|nr:HAD family hydrolase [Methylomagnum ishizawai]SMF97343.1 Haloacid dehalogenase-like hydrolase [Methylomagnum ishizawai]
MKFPNHQQLKDIDLVTVDVFDTLLQRKPISENRRLLNAVRSLCLHPDLKPYGLDPGVVLQLRIQAKRYAYRTLAIAAPEREITLDGLLAGPARLLGMPDGAETLWATLEVDQDAQSVRVNRKLCAALRQIKTLGKRVVALSDTYYSKPQIARLLEGTGCLGVVDDIHTSADLGFTKRGGQAFLRVAEREGVSLRCIIHIGDDVWADGVQAAKHGIQVFVTPQPNYKIALHKLDGGLFSAQRVIKNKLTSLSDSAGYNNHQQPLSKGDIGQQILGPITAEYCLWLWLYLASIPQPENTVALFCARGGLRMRRVFATVLERLGLSVPVRTEDFMVSRLVAARTALVRGSRYACAELAREHKHASLATVARALSSVPLVFGEYWNRPFSPEIFFESLDRDPAGIALRQDLSLQSDLFGRHLDAVAQGTGRLLLCDTGLFASTQRLLEEGMPERHWESVLFARANYKGFATPHFARATGLMVERNFYHPLWIKSIVLRYWHIVEALFEPELPSVKSFHVATDGGVVSNLEFNGWETCLDGAGDSWFAGTLEYLEDLRAGDIPKILADSEAAWRHLRRLILFPRRSDVALMAVDHRSMDFGRDSQVGTWPAKTVAGRFRWRELRESLWREGYIALACPRLNTLFQIAWESAYILRPALALMLRRR